MTVLLHIDIGTKGQAMASKMHCQRAKINGSSHQHQGPIASAFTKSVVILNDQLKHSRTCIMWTDQVS